jgi:hypothetical protein
MSRTPFRTPLHSTSFAFKEDVEIPSFSLLDDLQSDVKMERKSCLAHCPVPLPIEMTPYVAKCNDISKSPDCETKTPNKRVIQEKENSHSIGQSNAGKTQSESMFKNYNPQKTDQGRNQLALQAVLIKVYVAGGFYFDSHSQTYCLFQRPIAEAHPDENKENQQQTNTTKKKNKKFVIESHLFNYLLPHQR